MKPKPSKSASERMKILNTIKYRILLCKGLIKVIKYFGCKIGFNKITFVSVKLMYIICVMASFNFVLSWPQNVCTAIKSN